MDCAVCKNNETLLQHVVSYVVNVHTSAC